MRQRFEVAEPDAARRVRGGPAGGPARACSNAIDRQRALLDRAGRVGPFDDAPAGGRLALTDPKVRSAFDVERAEPEVLDRYGRNSFGWSLLMARRLVEAGVTLVQVNLGNNETWDTHGNAFPHLKDKLFPADRPGALGPARRPGGVGPARLDADRDGRRVRPDAEDQPTAAVLQAAGPRPLGARADGLARRRRRRGRPGGRLVRQDRRLSGVRPPDAREPGGDDLPGPRHPRDWPPGTTTSTDRIQVYHGEPIAGLV